MERQHRSSSAASGCSNPGAARSTRGWRGTRSLPLVALLACLPAPATGFTQQDPGSQATEVFPVQVETVAVDVIVTDGEGNPVADLSPADFSVREDGRPQEIVEFELVLAGEPGWDVEPGASRIATNASAPGEIRRLFVIVFDDLHLSPGSAKRAKSVLREYFKTFFQPGDQLSLVPTSAGAWWTVQIPDPEGSFLSYLDRLSGRRVPDLSPLRMSDYEAMRIHLERDDEVEALVSRRFIQSGELTGGGGLVEARAAEVYAQAAARTRATLSVLRRVLTSLEGVRSWKSVILVSDGFPHDPSLGEYEQVAEASRRSRTTIYSLDPRGQQVSTAAMGADVAGPLSALSVAGFGDMARSQTLGPREFSGSRSLAADSGGFSVGGTNNLAKAMWRIARESRAYYLIGYVPTNATRDGRFREIRVEVDRPGLKVRARKGYYAPIDGEQAERGPGQVDPRVLSALDAPYNHNDIPLRMTSYVLKPEGKEKATVLLAAEADPKAIDFQRGEGRFTATLEALIRVSARETGVSDGRQRQIDLDLTPLMRDRLERTWVPFSASFPLAAGAYQALVLVRDAASGHIGTVRHEFEVPDLERFRTSTPILTDTLQPDPGGTDPAPVPIARRQFASGARLTCLFDVYGAARDQSAGLPRVALGYALRRTDGPPVSPSASTPITPGPEGGISQRFSISLQGAQAGSYELVLVVRDEVSGRSLELHEPFVVEGGP